MYFSELYIAFSNVCIHNFCDMTIYQLQSHVIQIVVLHYEQRILLGYSGDARNYVIESEDHVTTRGSPAQFEI